MSLQSNFGVTFGGSRLDRTAHVRSHPDALSAARNNGRVILLWCGKPLAYGGACREGHSSGEDARLALLSAQHPLALDARDTEVFLGCIDDLPYFARDLSRWRPSEPVDPDQRVALFNQGAQAHPLAPDGAEFHDLRALMTHLSAEDAELAATARAVIGWHQKHGFCACCGTATQIAEAGWQRQCPACAARHFPRTDPVVIMLIVDARDRVLLGRSPQFPERLYSLLAGFVEPGETIEAAVRREVREESAVIVGDVSYLASQPWPFPMSLMIGCKGHALSSEITTDPAEIADACWIAKGRMVDIFAGCDPQIDPPRSGAIAHTLLRNWMSGVV